MQINLVPVSQRSISYGGEVITQAITRFRKFILAVIIICPEEGFEFEGEKASPDNITRAWISNTIVKKLLKNLYLELSLLLMRLTNN